MHVVQSIQPERQCLAHVTDHDLKVRIAVEYAGHDQAQQVHAHLDAKAKDGPVQPDVQHRTNHRVGRSRRVDVQGLTAFGERAEDRVELGLVQVFALRVAVDLHALKAEAARTAQNLACGPG